MVGRRARKAQSKKQDAVAANSAQTILQNSILPGQTTDLIDSEILTEGQKLLDLGVKQLAVDAWKEQVKEGAYRNNYLFEYNQLNVDEQKDAIESVLSGEKSLPGMDYESSVRFVNSFMRPEYNRNKAVLEAQSDYVIDRADDQTDILESGGRVSQDVIQEMRNSAVEVAEYDGGAAKKAVDELEADANLYSSFRGMSLAEMEATVQQYENGIEEAGGEGRDTTLEVKRYEQRPSSLKTCKRKYLKILWVMQNVLGLSSVKI